MMDWLFSIHNMFGLPEASDREPISDRELATFVQLMTFNLRVGPVNHGLATSIFKHLLLRPDMLRRRLVILRRAIAYEGNLSLFLYNPDEFTDCQLRELFRAVEDRVARRLGKKDASPAAGPFRSQATRPSEFDDVAVYRDEEAPDTKRGW